ncbi:MAG: arsenate reductase ArsC [Clostridia bacterium]
MENTKINLTNNSKPKVAFICNHNSCRSQMAQALGTMLASDVFESYSAGTIIKDHINPDAVRLMKEIYNIDMEATQYNKVIADIPKPDVVIFMGCNVSCPYLPFEYSENWGLDDPSGKDDVEFKKIIDSIHEKVLLLAKKLK